MDLPELEKARKLEAAAAAAESRVKAWLKANRDEVIGIASVSLALGLLIGYIVKTLAVRFHL